MSRRYLDIGIRAAVNNRIKTINPMRIPIKLPHPADALRAKSIKFRILSTRGDPPETGIAYGDGTLVVDGPDDDGLFEVFIHAEFFDGITGGSGTWTFTDVFLDQRAADCLKIQEDGSLLCLDPSIP